jgi:hypothetical protein
MGHPYILVIFDRVFMGLLPTQGDENQGLSLLDQEQVN